MRITRAFTVAVSVACACGHKSTPAQGVTIPVFAPLSGSDSARGQAVLDASVIANAALAGAKAAATLAVHDSSVGASHLSAALRSLATPVVILAGCNEATSLAQNPPPVPPIALVLFCDDTTARAAIVEADTNSHRFYWIGPRQIGFARALSEFLRDDSRTNGFDYANGNIVYSTTDAGTDVVAALSQMLRYNFAVQTLPIPSVDSTFIPDLTRTLALAHGQQSSFTYLFLPWLSTLEWLRQSTAYYSPAAFAPAIHNWFAPYDYLAIDGASDAQPIDIAGMIGFAQNGGTVNGAAVAAIDNAVKSELGITRSSVLLHLAVDTMSIAALAAESGGAWQHPDSFRRTFLAVTGPSANALTGGFEILPALIRAADAQQPVNYDGAYATFDAFDHYDQLSGALKVSVTQSGGAGQPNDLVDVVDIPDDPLMGRSVDLAAALSRGCLDVFPLTGSHPWNQSSFLRTIDRAKTTGLAPYQDPPETVGVAFHFQQPIALTGVFVQHFRSASQLVLTQAEHRVLWWQDAQPLDFDYRLPLKQPDGDVRGDLAAIGPWFSMEWALTPITVQTLVIAVNYTEGDPTAELFNDLLIFATEDSLANFCR